ncbi:hypothetical protein CWB96_00120 [Pseudoalteromonas citrea]|uniref:Uncharacterized protein n=1 Tax=Pseudoalteromonas citrea TaxID=43655 RepID=A0A5S3XVC0_9GAMM|nr:hypothetical protein [Pseudoalteromonas citrea]TMP46271.1 hypothetical protein CWB97_02115 [Pseudoalteromonas citrea]TMP63047.1 hypothetical protein CWB96_00120 [Pseudoalteromonas citrea]
MHVSLIYEGVTLRATWSGIEKPTERERQHWLKMSSAEDPGSSVDTVQHLLFTEPVDSKTLLLITPRKITWSVMYTNTIIFLGDELKNNYSQNNMCRVLSSHLPIDGILDTVYQTEQSNNVRLHRNFEIGSTLTQTKKNTLISMCYAKKYDGSALGEHHVSRSLIVQFSSDNVGNHLCGSSVQVPVQLQWRDDIDLSRINFGASVYKKNYLSGGAWAPEVAVDLASIGRSDRVSLSGLSGSSAVNAGVSVMVSHYH